MSKYKLVNRKTNERHLCDKVTVDGFDYYVSDEIIKDLDYMYTPFKNYVVKYEKIEGCILPNGWLKVIATTNPSIYVPKVVDDSYQKLDYNEYMNLCVKSYNKAKEHYKFTEEDMKQFSKFVVDIVWISGLEKSLDELFDVWLKDKKETIYFE